MNSYSAERKESVLKKFLPPVSMTVAEVSKEEGISVQTLYYWRKQLKQSGKPVPGQSKSSNNWSAEAKFAVVVETASLSETELSQYCREKGLYPEQVKEWKQECMSGFKSKAAQAKEIRQQTKADKAQIKSLKSELRHKEKALAETAALLVLRKKAAALFGEDSEDD